jgi:dihydroneopterin aldolase
MDSVFIKDLRVQGIIGIHTHERITPQEMLINISISTDTRRAAKTDNIDDCVNYQTIAEQVKAYAETSKQLTVEALAENIAWICLEAPGALGVRVRVEKTQAIAYTGSVGVEIEREKVEAGTNSI